LVENPHLIAALIPKRRLQEQQIPARRTGHAQAADERFGGGAAGSRDAPSIAAANRGLSSLQN